MHEKTAESSTRLQGSLGSFQLMAIGLGAIIGAGIFVITGQAAALYAGPAIVLSFIFSAIVCTFTALCYAELSAMIPSSGGSYTYAYVAMGEFPAWIVGWALTAQCLVSAATISVGWGGYFVNFIRELGLPWPHLFAGAPIVYSPDGGWTLSGSVLNIPAMLIVATVGVAVSIGIRAATLFNNIMVVIKLSTIALFLLLGFRYINIDNWVPFIPENTGIFGEFGWSGILRASGLVFFAYLGFDVVSTLAQDAKNPQKTLPLGILGSLGVSTLAYIATSLVLTGVVIYTALNVADPFSVALDAMGSQFGWIKWIVKLAILAGLSSAILVQVLGQTRIFYAISQDGLLPASLSSINKKTQTPLVSSILTASISLIIAGLFPISILAELVSMTSLFLFAVVCLGVLILRYSHPEYERKFKVPLVPWIPAIAILGCVGQMSFLPATSWLQLIGWLTMGLLVYFSYGIHRSKLRHSK